jgi:tRNA(Glu) U13 pseudouridine synthase TruD
VKSVFLGGEGRNELGDLFHDPAWRPEHMEPGVVEILMRRVVKDGWAVCDAMLWKRIPKLALGKGSHAAEAKNVAGLIQFAVERGADAVAFVRDRDRDAAREHALDKGIAWAKSIHGERIRVAGGIVVECLEAWVLATEGVRKTEDLAVSRAKMQLGEHCSTREMVNRIEAAESTAMADDAVSLRSWLERVHAALST